MAEGKLGFRFRSSIQFIATGPVFSSTLRITHIRREKFGGYDMK